MEELYKLIPDAYVDVLSTRLNLDQLSEIRIRNGRPVRVGYAGAYRYLCKSGVTEDKSAAFVAGEREAESIVMRACGRSLYTVTDTLKRGYIPFGGIRLGVCGSGVMSGGELYAVKDFSAVNIRVPHAVRDCANSLIGRVLSNGIVHNTLIISAPAVGKTTALRDLCRQLSDRGLNVLLCDEKYELAAAVGGVPTLDVGACTDVVSGIPKSAVFDMAVAHMRPDVIMTDELFGGDVEHVYRAVHCGISVIATVHARDLDDFNEKPDFVNMRGGIFSRFAVITDKPSRGVVVYDDRGNMV